MAQDQDNAWSNDVLGRYTENEKRIGTAFLAILILSLLYWASFVLFVQDPQRKLIPEARQFIEQIDQLQQDQALFRTQEMAKVVQATQIGERFLEVAHAALATRNPTITMDVQIKLQDKMLLGLINSTNATDFEDLLKKWLDRIHQFQVTPIVYESEVLDLWKSYYALNQTTGWLQRTAKAIGLPEVFVSSIPPELDDPAWSELSTAKAGLMFQDYADFEIVMNELQGFYQGPVTDEMQAKTLMGGRVWLRNLDSGRSIARRMSETEPSIRLPVVGENVTGRVAFTFAPFIYLVLMRYLIILVREAEELRAEIDRTGKGKHARYPHVLESLSRWITPQGRKGRADAALNKIIVIALLLLPASTVIPVTLVNAQIASGWVRYVVMATALAYLPPVFDTARLLRRYAWRARAVGKDSSPRMMNRSPSE